MKGDPMDWFKQDEVYIHGMRLWCYELVSLACPACLHPVTVHMC